MPLLAGSLARFADWLYFNPFTLRLLDKIGTKMRTAGCGHRFQQKDVVTALGRTITTRVPLDEKGSTSFCHKCLEKMVVPCAWCLEPIFVGDPVTLYCLAEKELKAKWEMSDEDWELCKSKGELPWGSKIHSVANGYVSLVGCPSTTCADTGADYCGVWMPPGQVEEHLSMIKKALQSGAAMVAGDPTNPSELVVK